MSCFPSSLAAALCCIFSEKVKAKLEMQADLASENKKLKEQLAKQMLMLHEQDQKVRLLERELY